jgi:glutathione synthase/RimK-type ligase-like ATP-grasp enzyme
MIVCLYGRPFAPFVESVARDLRQAAIDLGGDIRPLTIEDACRLPRGLAGISRLYILPFDTPASHAHLSPQDLVAELFPNAQPVVNLGTHELCWNKITTQERLLDRGVPMPETLVTSDPADVVEFVRQHQFAVLKESQSCGGHGHLVVWFDGDVLAGDGGSHRYIVELTGEGSRRINAEHLQYPAPFYLQRLIADIGPHGVTPAQVLRAYIVEREIVFWTERYRERYVRPSDWIINSALGARVRFVQTISDEAQKIALRAAEAVGARVCAVDLVRTARGGTYVLEVDTDGVHMFIDRSFKQVPEYRDFFDFDGYIARALVNETAAAERPGF